MVVHEVRRVLAWREGRNEQRGGAETAQPVRVPGAAGGGRNRRGRRRHVVEEPAPFVEVDEEHGAVPRRPPSDGGVDLIEERLTSPHVAEWQVDRPGPGRFSEERRV